MYRLKFKQEAFTVSGKANNFAPLARSIFSFGFGSNSRDKKNTKKNEINDASDPCGKLKDPGIHARPRYDLSGHCLPKVIIIGGGLAGMCAADYLIKASIKDVMILEAADRSGGRIYSTWLADANVELGPAQITGASMANPVFNLANTSKAHMEKVKPQKSVFLTNDGRFITDYGLEKLIFDNLMEDARVAGKRRLKTSLLQFLALRIQQQLLRLPATMRFDAERVLFGMINSMRASHGTTLSNVSAASLSEKTYMIGGSVRVTSGMNTIMSNLLATIPQEQFLMNKTVDKVMNVNQPKPGKRVKVVCTDGDSYNADYVISTVPIGVLKAKGSRMFAGNLNPKKLTAIDKIGSGLKNNIYFEFSRPWWPPGDSRVQLAWSAEELENRSSWTKGITLISAVTGSKSLLRVAVAGPEAQIIENCPEEELAFDFTAWMRKMMGDPSLPYPSGVVMSRWLCNPLSKGATVFMGVETTPGMFNDLAGGSGEDSCESTPSAVLFAGDATVPKYFGTLIGAKISGVREAKRILEAVKRGVGVCNRESSSLLDEQGQSVLENAFERQQACRN